MTGSILATLLCLAPPTPDASSEDGAPSPRDDDAAAPPPALAEGTQNPSDAPTGWDESVTRTEPATVDDASTPAAGPVPSSTPLESTSSDTADSSELTAPTSAQPERSTESSTPEVAVRAPTPPRPDRPIRFRLDLQLDGGTHVVSHGSFDGFSTNHNLAGLSIGVRADFRLAESRFFLGGGVAYRTYGSSREAYGSLLSNEVRLHEPLVFLRLSAMALEGIDVYLEPGGGPTIANVEVSSMRDARQRSVSGMFNGLAGVALYLPKAWLPNKGASRVTAGLDLGLGYGWRGSIRVQPSPETDDEPLSTSSARLGDLALRGFIWRAGLFIRFM